MQTCLQLATAHGTCGFVNGRSVNCNETGHAVTITFILDISEKHLVKLCLLFYNVIRWYQGQKLQKPFVLARLGFWAWDPQKHEDAAIFKENQRIRMFLELRKLHSNGAIRGYQLGAKYLLTTTSTHAPVYWGIYNVLIVNNICTLLSAAHASCMPQKYVYFTIFFFVCKL